MYLKDMIWAKDSIPLQTIFENFYLIIILFLNTLVWFKSASLSLCWIELDVDLFYFCNSKLLFQKYLAIEISQTFHFNWDIFAKQNGKNMHSLSS